MLNKIKNNKGMTLVEVLIAMVVLLLVFLALMQTALVSIDSNMVNVLRDEAVSVAEMTMNEATNTPLDSLAIGTTTSTVTRQVRNMTKTFSISRVVSAAGTDTKQVNIIVSYDWKEHTGANAYTHTISTIMGRE